MYSTRFAAGSARYIYLEVKLDYVAPGQALQGSAPCHYRRADGTSVGSLAGTIAIQAAWNGSFFTQGYGSLTSLWSPGRYTVECTFAGQPFVRARFEVVEGLPDRLVRYDVPGARARVDWLRFVASSGTLPPLSERRYADRFDSRTLRFLRWEIRFNHEPPGQRVAVPIICTWYQPNGKLLVADTLDGTIEAEWRNAHLWGPGRGWPDPGRWGKGRYRVRCMMDAGFLAQREFVIE